MGLFEDEENDFLDARIGELEREVNDLTLIKIDQRQQIEDLQNKRDSLQVELNVALDTLEEVETQLSAAYHGPVKKKIDHLLNLLKMMPCERAIQEAGEEIRREIDG